MTALAYASPNGGMTDSEQIARPVRDKIRVARDWRRRNYEPTWALCMALAAGKHWMSYDRFTRTLRRIQDTDPRYKDRELYTADMVTEYRTTMLGELGSDNDRPQLLLARDDEASEEYAAQANRAISYGWDNEWMGDDVLAQIDRYMLDLGTAAVRCHWDPDFGPTVADNVPFMGGQPQFGADAQALFQDGPNPAVQMGAIRQGRIRWTALSALNLIVPPGVVHEDLFPWECVVVPTLLDDVKDLYGAPAQNLTEDGDIGSVLGNELNKGVDNPTQAMQASRDNRLRDHVWLYTYLERPSRRYPKGRKLVFGGADLTLLDVQEQLDYQDSNGQYRSGVAYFHWWRVTGRFFSRGLVEAMIDGQNLLNKRRTQLNEMIDRGMPKTYVERGSKALDAENVPGEYVELEKDERVPVPSPGLTIGPWFQQDVEATREDLEHSTGIKGPRLGENPANIGTYSQLALINESEQVKREQIHRERKLAIKQLIEDSLYDIRTYWGPQRQLLLAGDDGRMQAEIFDATRLPPFYVLDVASGAAKPRTQAAKLKMIDDIALYSVNSGQPVPVEWVKQSYEAGEPLELPPAPSSDQVDKAELENHLLLQGQQVPVAYYDRVDLHIPTHRVAQDEAMLAGDQNTWQRIEEHVQAHLQAAQENAAQVQQMQPQLTPAPPPSA